MPQGSGRVKGWKCLTRMCQNKSEQAPAEQRLYGGEQKTPVLPQNLLHSHLPKELILVIS